MYLFFKRKKKRENLRKVRVLIIVTERKERGERECAVEGLSQRAKGTAGVPVYLQLGRKKGYLTKTTYLLLFLLGRKK